MALRIREPLAAPLRVDTSVPCGFSGRVNVPARLAEVGSPDTDGAQKRADTFALSMKFSHSSAAACQFFLNA